MLTIADIEDAITDMPPEADDAVVHLCVDGLPYLPVVEITHEANQDGGPGVVLVQVDPKRLVEELGIDGPIRKLLEEIRDSYEPGLIAYDNAVEALACLDGAGARIHPKTP